MRRDLLWILLIAAVAFGVRTYPAWNGVFTTESVSFLETDAWYHVRLAEHQVHNYPWRVTVDPYAAPGGQFVPIAPLFDTITATIAVTLHGRDAGSLAIERVAAFVPPVLGTLTVIAIWLLGRVQFERRAGLLSAALLAVLPGHFLDRTMLGFVDHHALEACLAVVTILTFARGMATGRLGPAVVAGFALGAYLLSWGSGAFLLAVFGVSLVAFALLARTNDELSVAASTTGVAAVVALVLVVAFQDPRMHRYGSQLLGLTGLAALAAAAAALARGNTTGPRKRVVIGALVIVALLAAFAVMRWFPALVRSVFVDVLRLAPDPTRMGVLEARPMFLYAGNWRWDQPWLFFRTGFFIGLAALVPFGVRVWRQRRAIDVVTLVYALTMFIATIGQNRFGYYLVTACAMLGGWLAVTLLDWGGVPHADDRSPTPRTSLPLARELSVIAVAGGMFAPNVAPSVLLSERSSSIPPYWRQTMTWLREHTPAPFASSAGRGDDYYYARYPHDHVPLPDYSVMSWWDHGYWIAQMAHRVPVANPTQERASIAGRFYSATDEAQAIDLLRSQRSGYVLSDWELPFRRLADGTIMGRFQNVVDWAGGEHAQYYEIVYRRDEGQWVPVWIFHEPYYRSMAFRLSVLGGAAATPAHTTSLLTLADRVDSRGIRFRELLSERTYTSYEAAREAASATSTPTVLAGLDPWRTAFPLDAMRSLAEVHASRSAEQKRGEAPWVRVFQLR